MGDWVLAENALITEQYQRQIQADLSMMMSFTEQDSAKHANSVLLSKQEYNVLTFTLPLPPSRALGLPDP